VQELIAREQGVHNWVLDSPFPFLVLAETFFLVFSAPILIVTALAYVYIFAFPRDNVE
jgi:hypothetical protein